MFELKRYGILPALFAALPLLGLALGAAACTDDGGDGPEEPDTPVQVGFTISARAEAGDGHGFNQGTEAEYALYKDKLHFYLFDNAGNAGDSKFIAEFTPTSVSPVGTGPGTGSGGTGSTGGTGTSGTGTGTDAAGEVIGTGTEGIDTSWYVEGELSADVAKKCAGGFRFVVLANVAEGLDTTQPDLRLSAVNAAARKWDKKATASSGFVSAGDLLPDGLPMYGCRRYTAAAFRPEVQTDLGEINLLRALARVEVVWVSEHTLNNLRVVFPTGNDAYYLAPKDPGQTTSHDASDGWLNACTSGNAENAVMQRHFAKIDGATNTEGKPVELYRCYLPEYALPTDPAAFGIVLHYQRNDSGKIEPDESNSNPNIFFANYLPGASHPTQSAYPLVRNHIYRFTVSVNDSMQSSVYYAVCKWETGSAEIEFD